MKFMLISAGVCALVMVLLAISVFRSIRWFENSLQDQPAINTPLQLSAGEKEDVQRVLLAIHEAKNSDTTYEDFLSPQVLNGVLDWMREEELKKGKETASGIRIALDPEGYKIGVSMRAPKPDGPAAQAAEAQDGPLKVASPKKYVNVEALVDLEIKNGKLTRLEAKSFTVGGSEPPLLIRWMVSAKTKELIEQSQKGTLPGNGLKMFQTLDRTDGRIHIVIDGKHVPD